MALCWLMPAGAAAFPNGAGNCEATAEAILGMNDRERNAPGVGPYRVVLEGDRETYEPGREHMVTITSDDEDPFNGLLLYAETMLGERVGEFDLSDSFLGSPTVACPGGSGATASHAFAGPMAATSLSIPWTAPDQDVGPIVFRSIVLGGARGDPGSQAFFFPSDLALVVAGDGAVTFEINQGIAGAWFDPATAGQGFLIDVEPESSFIFVAWFTFEAASAKVGAAGQRWLTAQGNYQGGSVEMTLSNTAGGAFDDPTATTTTAVGSMTLSFESCDRGTVDYAIDGDGLTGTIEISRVIPGTQALCEALAGAR